jgi:hypothetical protein
MCVCGDGTFQVCQMLVALLMNENFLFGAIPSEGSKGRQKKQSRLLVVVFKANAYHNASMHNC